MKLTEVVKNLIIINAIVYFAQVVLGEYIDVQMGYSHFPLSMEFRPFQIATSMFMHADVQHLFFNMLSLFFLGPTVERSLGGRKFLILYMVAGLIGTFLHMGIDYFEFIKYSNALSPDIVERLLSEGRNVRILKTEMTPSVTELYKVIHGTAVGASGAVYGIVIAFVTMFPKQKLMIFPIPIGIPAFILGIGMVGYGVVSGIGNLDDGIGHFAHLGGALTGFLLVHYWEMANLR